MTPPGASSRARGAQGRAPAFTSLWTPPSWGVGSRQGPIVSAGVAARPLAAAGRGRAPKGAARVRYCGRAVRRGRAAQGRAGAPEERRGRCGLTAGLWAGAGPGVPGGPGMAAGWSSGADSPPAAYCQHPAGSRLTVSSGTG